MNRGVWVAAVTLGLGGFLSDGWGQDNVWRPTTRPDSPPATVRAAGVQQSVWLGRPVAITRGLSPASVEAPRPFPPAYRVGTAAASGRFTGVEPIATVPPPGAVIAASVPAAVPWTGQQEHQAPQDQMAGDLFAMDRLAIPGPRPALLPTAVGETEKLVNWQGTFPGKPPAEQPPDAAEAGSGGDLPPTKWYARGEYLLWWTKNDTTPPLVTTAPASVNGSPAFGALGQPGTTVLFGGGLDRNPFSGGRFALGYYLDDCAEKALELSGFFLGQRSASFEANSGNTPVIARPFFAVNPGPNNGQTVQLVSFPGLVTGQVRVRTPSELWGLEANLFCQWCCGCNWRVDPFVGFRYLNLHESVSVHEDLLFGPASAGVPPNLAGKIGAVDDRFATTNQFYGGQVGVEGRWQQDRWTLDGRAKLGLGATHQSLLVNGSQELTDPVTHLRTQFVGGLLALDSNIGRFDRTRFAVVPELSLTAGYYLTDRLRALVGYNFLYWSSVVRPGEQIDPRLDLNRIPNFLLPNTPAPAASTVSPARLFNTTDFWAQGVTLGLEYRY